MLAASPFRALASSLLVSLFMSPRGADVEAPRDRAFPSHTLAPVEKEAKDLLGPKVAWAEALPEVVVQCGNTNAVANIRLYRDDGVLDDTALDAFMETVAERDDVRTINPRTIQLAFKAAYHFKSPKIFVVSSWRRGHGPHASGDALDFRLDGVGAARLAAYLRTVPRAGVGIYTHPATQYVHVDARDQSFHWLDASPPGKTWREAALADKKRDERDAAWTEEQDLPTDPPAPPKERAKK
jgi:hypothetical protein